MLLKCNYIFRNIFLKYLKTESNSGSYYYGGKNSYSKYIYFYDSKSRLRSSRLFNNQEEFNKYLDEQGITYSSEQKSIIEKSNWVYATIIPDTKILVVKDKYYAISDILDMYAEGKVPVSSVALLN